MTRALQMVVAALLAGAAVTAMAWRCERAGQPALFHRAVMRAAQPFLRAQSTAPLTQSSFRRVEAVGPVNTPAKPVVAAPAQVVRTRQPRIAPPAAQSCSNEQSRARVARG